RVSFTGKGILGPKHWLRTTPSGDQIIFLSKDQNNHTNAFGISPNGGSIHQLTFHDFDIQTGPAISPDGKLLAYVADNCIYISAIDQKKVDMISRKFSGHEVPINAIHWSPDGKRLAYNSQVTNGENSFLQIFLIDL
ncbi:MAG: hypothetical protein WKF89_09670, partial [Chitinophagaceae bacterium]